MGLTEGFMSQPTEEELKNMSPEQIAELQKQNCLFCKIVAGEVPSKKVYEDEHFLGVLDIYPANEGHVLLMPKKHLQVMPQMPGELVGAFAVACKKVSEKLIGALQAQGTSVFIANGLHAGQKAPHFMAHVIPRNDGDSVGLAPGMKELSEKDLAEVKSKLTGGANAKETPSKKEGGKNGEKSNEGKADLDAVSKLFG